jgi:hypothetical protein
LGKAKYIATFLDDYSGFSAVVLLKHKSDTYNAIRDIINLFETQTESKIKAARSDNGGEYINTELKDYFKEKGINHQTTMPYSPQSNGKAERLNRTLMEKARAMLSEANLPEPLWGEAITTANYLRTGHPQPARTRRRGSCSTARSLTCLTCAPLAVRPLFTSPSTRETSWVTRRRRASWLDTCPTATRILLDNNSVQTSRDVVFNEANTLTQQEHRQGEDPLEDDTFDDDMPSLCTESEDEDDSSGEEDDGPGDGNNDNGGGNGGGPPTQAPSTTWPQHLARHPAQHQHQHPPLAAADRTGSRANRGVPAARYDQIYTTQSTIIITEPETVEEALSSEHAVFWKQAMDDEIESLLQNNTWSLEKPPAGVKPIPVKWVFKVKRDATGRFERFKARLVVKGFRQQEGIDYNEVFAPVSKYVTVRTLMAKAAAEDLDLHQIDIKTAFLHGDLEETIYMQQPSATKKAATGTACKLNKSLYGLKQAPRAWYTRLHKELDEHWLCAFTGRPQPVHPHQQGFQHLPAGVRGRHTALLARTRLQWTTSRMELLTEV